MRSARQSAIRLLQLMMIASIVLPAVLLGFAAWFNYRPTQEDADERIERSLDILHEHALKVFQTGERALAEGAGAGRGLSDDELIAEQTRPAGSPEEIVDAGPPF